MILHPEADKLFTEILTAQQALFEMSYEEMLSLRAKAKQFLAGIYPDFITDAVLRAASEVELVIDYVQTCKREEPSDFDFASHMINGYLRRNFERLASKTTERAMLGATLALMVGTDGTMAKAEICPIYFDAVSRRASVFLERGETMPADLASFCAKVLRGDIRRPDAKRGVPAHANFARDSVIICAVRVGTKHGIPATRNDVSPPLSACDVVADFLAESDLEPATFASVKRIWLTGGAAKRAFL